MILLAGQTVNRLGSGSAVDIPVGRIVIAFLICVGIAFLAILLIRQRMGRNDLSGWVRRIGARSGAIDVVEVRRLSVQSEIGLVRHDGREYLLLLQGNSSRVLREREIADQAGSPS